MRGADEQPGSMFSYVSLEERVPAGSSVAGDPPDHRSRAGAALAAASARCMCNFGRPSIPPEKLLRALAAAGALHDSQRAAADGAAGLQPAVSLVRGPGHGRRRVVADDVHARIAIGCCDGDIAAALLRRGVDPRRHASGCCRTSISPSTARCSRRGRVRRASGRATRSRRPSGGGNPTVEFSRPAADAMTTHQSTTDPDARLYKKAQRPRGAPRLLGPCADGASVGADRQGARSRPPTGTANAMRRW